MPQTKEQRRKFYIKNRERLLAAANEKYAKTRKKIWTIPVERQCNSCKITKPMSEFHKATKRRIGHQSVCKKCNYLYSKEKREANRALFTKRQRKTVLKSKYGMTPDEFSKLLNQQNGVCKICSKEETGKAARTRLVRQVRLYSMRAYD